MSIAISPGRMTYVPAPGPLSAGQAETPEIEFTLSRQDTLTQQHVTRVEQLAVSVAGLGDASAKPDQTEVLRRQLMLELQRFHDFEYPIESSRPPRTLAGTNAQSADFFGDLIDLIDLIGADYLAVYERLVEQYSAVYREFNERVMAKMADWIKGVNDGKEVEFNADALRAAIQDVLNQFDNVVLFPIPNSDGSLPNVSYAEALNWALAMGIPASQIRRDPVRLMLDMSPLVAMRDALPRGTAVRWDSAKFQAWQTGFNSQEAEMKNQLQVFTSKYSNANAYHDNFNKILSAQLSQYAEMLKAYLNF